MSGRFLVNARAMWLGIGAAISALVVNLAATQHGLGFSPDSASYLSAGLNLAGGQGLVTYSGDPLTIFPPGVSIVVAAGRVVGLDPIVWMRVFNSICIGVTVLLAHVVAKRYLQSRLLLTTTTFYIAWSLPLATVGQMLWSEPPFLAASTAFIAYIDTIRDKNLTTRRTCVLASLASTAFLFRYSGIALIPLGAIIVARYARPTRRIERCRLALRFAVVASVVPVLLMLRNLSADSTLMGARSPSADSIISSLHMVASTIGRWATFEASETVAPNRLGVVIVSVVLVAAIWHSIVAPQSRVAPLAIYAVGYLASVVLAQVSTALDVIGSRLLSPLFVPFVLILSVQFSNVVRSRGVGWRGFRTVIAVTAAGSLLVASLSSLVDLSVRSSRHGIGFSTDGWRRSSLAHAAARLPSDSLIYSNQPGGLWVTVRREPILVAPERTAWRSDALKPISPGFLRDATCSQTYLAWFYDATSNFYEPEELRRPAKLERVSEHSDGMLYRSSGQPSATGC